MQSVLRLEYGLQAMVWAHAHELPKPKGKAEPIEDIIKDRRSFWDPLGKLVPFALEFQKISVAPSEHFAMFIAICAAWQIAYHNQAELMLPLIGSTTFYSNRTAWLLFGRLATESLICQHIFVLLLHLSFQIMALAWCSSNHVNVQCPIRLLVHQETAFEHLLVHPDAPLNSMAQQCCCCLQIPSASQCTVTFKLRMLVAR